MNPKFETNLRAIVAIGLLTSLVASQPLAGSQQGVPPELDFMDGFESPAPQPDLVVVSPGVNESSLEPGQMFTIEATVENQGPGTAAATTLRYFISNDNSITNGDTELGSDPVPSLAPAGQSPQDLDSTAPGIDGTYWVGACVDAVAEESDTDNQCSVAVEITVLAPTAPDLVVISPGVSESSLEPGEAFTVSATARNQGDAASDPSTLRYFQSLDNVIDTDDTELGTDTVPALAPASNSAQNLPTTAPGGTGTYWLGACIDAVAGESDANNQCSSGVEISVVAPVDTDGDRLPDSAETNTGIFVDASNTGTDPNNPDTDGDSIDDGDEVLGTLDGLDLPAMGLSPVHKDLLMEYDWFDDALGCAAHSHRPTSNAIALATAAFANSPVPNPDGVNGVNLVSDYGQGGPFTGGNFINDADGVIAGGVSGADFMNYKNANFENNRRDYFHYVLLPHRYNTDSSSSGQAERPGNDLIVSLYCAYSDHNVAHTILHEVGHNLNLRHGGNVNCNYKPNYNSVMNYRYQFPGVDNNCTPPGDGVLSYSIGDRITLNENSLNENNGTCGPGFEWDWNDDDSIDNPVSFDINTYDGQVPECGGLLTTLSDYNDWANLFFGGIIGGDRAPLFQPQIITEQEVPAEYRLPAD